MITELAIERTYNRVNEMFEHFTNRIREVGEDKVDQKWFRSEEFQTLLFEALHQLHVTHDREKIEILGVALANSGTEGFKEEERKDLFIRLVRELTRAHLKLLAGMSSGSVRLTWKSEKTYLDLPAEFRRTERPEVRNDNVFAFRILQAYGLVDEKSYDGIAPAVRCFFITNLGRDFLRFIGLPRNPTLTEANEKPATA